MADAETEGRGGRTGVWFDAASMVVVMVVVVVVVRDAAESDGASWRWSCSVWLAGWLALVSVARPPAA